MSSSRKCADRLFQTRGPAAAKFLSPNVSFVHGTAHNLSVDEWSQRLGPSKTKRMSSAKYGGAWLNQLKTYLNLITAIAAQEILLNCGRKDVDVLFSQRVS